MTRHRVIETDEGIQDEIDVASYDRMMRGLRDRGWIYTEEIIKSGITKGTALEIGPGPGYLGLEWLRKTIGSKLVGLDISPSMAEMAEKNAVEYAFSEGRAVYVVTNAKDLPFEDEVFDAVFTTNSLHEWDDPVHTFNEIHRVLKTGGRFFVGDLRRDMNFLIKTFMKLVVREKEMRKGLVTSINAAYTRKELLDLLRKTEIDEFEITTNPMSLMIKGLKL